MQENHPCFRKGRNDYEAECLVCKSAGTYISVVHKGNGDLNTYLQSVKTSQSSKNGCCMNENDKLLCYSRKQMRG